jgi:hypothetical protein
MRASEILIETRAIKVGNDFKSTMVWVNPSNAEIKEFLKRGELRAWVHPKHLLCWLGDKALHETILDDLIEMGELEAEYGRLASKALIVDERGNFGNFDLWEEGENNVISGDGATLLFDDWGHDVKNFRPVRRAMGLVSTEPTVPDIIPSDTEMKTIAALKG